MKKIIISLCAGTKSWERPYIEHPDEYDVRSITLPDNDVLTYVPPDNVYGILAAPPCTMFSFARTRAKKPRDLKEGMECVRACLNIIWSIMEVKQDTGKKTLPLKFWALENPYYGFLKKFLGKPSFTFDPWNFGDAYKKKTSIWGNFNEPVIKFTDISEVLTEHQIEKHKTNPQVLPKFDMMKSSDIHPESFGIYSRQARRSITPEGFARAFFKANQ